MEAQFDMYDSDYKKICYHFWSGLSLKEIAEKFDIDMLLVEAAIRWGLVNNIHYVDAERDLSQS